ncbi:hypothetical protein HPB50_007749 [Hyalomma asiaticum]|uniref:Uncharacterized protein n=1 Tax=Hyalomma asiaticum TaxID=266040 RepID=A0ACB7TCP0_HYAAI|nr:hypothetical protein HPB50_007749 [Hyalomma asiaticum]
MFRDFRLSPRRARTHLACAPHLFDLISATGSYSLAKFAKDLLCAFRLPFGTVGGAGTKILRRFLPLSAGAEASPGVYAPAVMVYTVEGEQIDPAVLRDGSWQHPKRPADPLDLQKHFGRKKTDPTEPPADLGRTGASAASKSKSRPPQLPRRKPMPRLPDEDYKIVLRPKCPVNLTNIGLVALLEAIYTTTKVDQAQAEQADQVRVHPIKNTITISTPDKARANAYRALGLLRSEEYSVDMPVSAYVPAPGDSIRGLSRELDKTISGGHNSQHGEPAKHVAWGSGKPHHRESTVPQVAAPLETPSEQKPRNARILTHTREERSGFKTSQAVREEGSQARHQQSKPQQQQQDPQFEAAFQLVLQPYCMRGQEVKLNGKSLTLLTAGLALLKSLAQLAQPSRSTALCCS